MTQERIQPSPLLHHVWYFTAALPWWFSGYPSAVVAPAPGLGHTTGTFLQGQGKPTAAREASPQGQHIKAVP